MTYPSASDRPPFTLIFGLAFHPNGNLYITESTRNQIQVLTGSITFIQEYKPGEDPRRRLRYPAGISVSSKGRVVLVDNENHRVLLLTENLEFISKIGSMGSGQLNFSGPRHVAFGPDDMFYVADWLNQRICKYDHDGNFVQLINDKTLDSPFVSPWSLIVTEFNEIFCAGPSGNVVYRISSVGKLIGAYQIENGGLVSALCRFCNGGFAMADNSTHEISFYSRSGTLLHKIKKDGGVTAMQFSQDNRFFVATRRVSVAKIEIL